MNTFENDNFLSCSSLLILYLFLMYIYFRFIRWKPRLPSRNKEIAFRGLTRVRLFFSFKNRKKKICWTEMAISRVGGSFQ